MAVGVQVKGVSLAFLLFLHSVLGSPLVKRDLAGISESAIAPQESSIQSAELLDESVFGGGGGADGGGAREKRLLKLKALGLGAGLGAGLKAAGAGVKAVGVAAGKAVAKKAVKAAVTVGATVAKAAITIGIAKLLLTLVFGKINQLIDFKTRLLSGGGGSGGLLGSSNLSGLSGGGGAAAGGGAGASASVGAGASADVGGDTSFGLDVTTEALPMIDPDKVSLQVPGEIIEGGFNVVNKAAPVVGEVIQRTAERVVRLVGGLKPILGSSLGFKVTQFKRDASTEEPPFPSLDSATPPVSSFEEEAT